MRGLANNDRQIGAERQSGRATATLSAAALLLALAPLHPAAAGGNEDYRIEMPQGAAAPAYGGGYSPAMRPPPTAASGSDPVMDALGMQTIVIGGSGPSGAVSAPSGVSVDMSVLDELGGRMPAAAPRAPTGLRPPPRRVAAPAKPPAHPATRLDASLVPPPPDPAPRPAAVPSPAPAVEPVTPPVPVAPPPVAAPVPAQAPPPAAPVEVATPGAPRTLAMVELGTRLTDTGEVALAAPPPIAAPPAQIAMVEPPAAPPAASLPPEPASPPEPAPIAAEEPPPDPVETPVAKEPPEPAAIVPGEPAGDSGGSPMELAALPAPAPVTGNLPTAATAVGVVRFDTTSDVLTDNGKAALERMLEQLKEPQGRVLIRGFASGLNDTATGARRLALHRIQAVRTFLIENGVPAARIDLRAVGMAPDAPVADGVDIALLP